MARQAARAGTTSTRTARDGPEGASVTRLRLFTRADRRYDGA